MPAPQPQDCSRCTCSQPVSALVLPFPRPSAQPVVASPALPHPSPATRSATTVAPAPPGKQVLCVCWPVAPGSTSPCSLYCWPVSLVAVHEHSLFSPSLGAPLQGRFCQLIRMNEGQIACLVGSLAFARWPMVVCFTFSHVRKDLCLAIQALREFKSSSVLPWYAQPRASPACLEERYSPKERPN